MKAKYLLFAINCLLVITLIAIDFHYSKELDYFSKENDRLLEEIHSLRTEKTLDTTYLNFINSNDIDKNIYEAMGHFKILFPDLVYAQSILETGYYSSTLCIDSNNILGLYDSSLKQYRKYDYWWESLYDYKRLVQNKYKGNKDSIEEYFLFLDTLPYAQDTTYINKLKEVYYELNFE